VHPDLSGGRHTPWLLHDGLEFLTSPGLAVSWVLAEEHIHELFIFPLEPCGVPRSPVGDAADVEMATEDGGREESVRRH
jgi:hypothetical protein